jgi:hypothetical protein
LTPPGRPGSYYTQVKDRYDANRAGAPPVPTGDDEAAGGDGGGPAGQRHRRDLPRRPATSGRVPLRRRRLTIRLDRGLLQLVTDGVLLRSLPNPLTQPSWAG